jgi:uncharacterized protein (TIGR03437 family)
MSGALFLMRFSCGTLASLFAFTLQAQVTIVNVASFRGEQPVAAGSLAAAFGAFSGVTTSSASGFPLPPTLGGVTVHIRETQAPLIAVSATQINFQVPGALAPGRYPVTVTDGGTQFNGNVIIMSAAPGIFIIDTTVTPGLGAILNQDNSVNGSGSRAARGSVITIYGTGPGALSSPIPDGQAAGSSPLVSTRSTPRVLIAGVDAEVRFSGMTPGSAGLWQVNAVVPNQAFIQGRVPVQIFMDGVDSNEVSLFVAP